jgi:hypothetical protein
VSSVYSGHTSFGGRWGVGHVIIPLLRYLWYQ